MDQVISVNTHLLKILLPENILFWPICPNFVYKQGRIHGYPSRMRVGRSSAGEGL